MTTSAQTICYSVSEEGIITSLSEIPWLVFAKANAGSALLPAAVVGHPLEEFLWGDEVRASYRIFHEALLKRVVNDINILCQCDAPTVRRIHRLHIGLGQSNNRQTLCYTSTIVHEFSRPAVPILLAPTDKTPGATEALLIICSYCKRMSLPPVAEEERTWIPAWLYEKHCGDLNIRISHGLCRDCKERHINPVLAKLQQRRREPV